MNDNIDRQFQEADVAVEKVVTACMRKIESMFGKWEAVTPAYIVERLLLALCAEMIKLIDEDWFADSAGTETLKLSNALVDYRDARAINR
jgi:hypothetical protein